MDLQNSGELMTIEQKEEARNAAERKTPQVVRPWDVPLATHAHKAAALPPTPTPTLPPTTQTRMEKNKAAKAEAAKQAAIEAAKAGKSAGFNPRASKAPAQF